MEEKINISTDQICYNLGEKIKFTIQSNKDISEFNFIRLHFYKINIGEEYNFGIATITFDFKLNQYNKYEVSIDAKHLKPEIIFIGKIELLKQEKWDAQFPVKIKEFETKQISQNHFKITNATERKISIQDLTAEIREINKKKQEQFYKGVGDLKSTIYYSTYFFIKNIYLTKRFTYGQCEIIPYSKFSVSTLYDYINNFIEKEIKITEKIVYDLNERISYENPGIIIFHPKIFATDVNHAFKTANKEVDTLIKSFSISRETKGEIISAIIIDYSSAKLYFTEPETFTASNIMAGEIAGENPFLNRGLQNLIKKNRIFELITNLYYDAVNEKYIEIKYSKLWTILEILAENKNYPKSILKKIYLSGQKISNNTKDNKPTIKDKVREYIRENLNQNDLLSGILREVTNKLEKLDDIITIWYRHRNCMVHSGGCQPNNRSICKASPDYTLCNSKYFEIIKENGNRETYNDTYLLKLQESVRCIILNFYINETGDNENISPNIFLKVSQVPKLQFKEIPISSFGVLEHLSNIKQ